MGGATIGCGGSNPLHFSKVGSTGGKNCSTGGTRQDILVVLAQLVKASKTVKYQRKFMIPNALFAVLFVTFFIVLRSTCGQRRLNFKAMSNT